MPVKAATVKLPVVPPKQLMFIEFVIDADGNGLFPTL